MRVRYRGNTKGRIAGLLVSVTCLGLIAFFGYHSVWGNNGLLTLRALESRSAALESALGALQAERLHLERRVDLLKPDRLDPDMLDERVRSELGFSHPDEIVIFRRPPEGIAPRP
jgi:cell division protein FtsB